MSETGGGHRAGWVWPLLCIVMAVISMYLAYQNIQLKNQLAAVNSYAQLPVDLETLNSNDNAVPFEAYLPDGQELVLHTDSLKAPLILAWLSAGCEPCELALGIWNQLAAMYPGQLWGVLKRAPGESGVSLSYGNVAFPVLEPVSDTVYALYKIHFTPQTMVVMEDGTIARVWSGPLDQRSLDVIINLMQEPYAKEVSE